MLQMTAAEHEHPVKAFRPRGADPPLGVSVGPRSPDRSLDDPRALGAKHLVERTRELRVPVPDHVADTSKRLPHREVASLLSDPRRVRVPGHPQDRHPTRRDVDGEQHTERLKQDRLHSEEVQGEDRASLGAQECAPGGAVSAGSRTDAIGAQQRPDLGRRDPDAEFRELTPNPDASPPRVLPAHPEDEVSNVLGDRWSASRRSPTEGPLPPHQLPVPPKERLGADQERRPPSSRKDPAHRGHEHPVLAAKARAAHLALEDLQLVTKDHELDFGIELFDG